jgi:hypothetical protein
VKVRAKEAKRKAHRPKVRRKAHRNSAIKAIVHRVAIAVPVPHDRKAIDHRATVLKVSDRKAIASKADGRRVKVALVGKAEGVRSVMAAARAAAQRKIVRMVLTKPKPSPSRLFPSPTR